MAASHLYYWKQKLPIAFLKAEFILKALSTFVIFAPLFPSAKTAAARRLPSHLKSICKQEKRQMAAAQFKPAQDPASPLHRKYYP